MGKGKDKLRAENFSEEEIRCLKFEVGKNIKLIQEKFADGVTSSQKHAIWELITEKVNSVSKVKRNADAVKKKWKNVSSEAKKTIATKMNKTVARKTGGGKAADELTPEENEMLGIIGKEVVLGIENGFDTSAGGLASRKNVREKEKSVESCYVNSPVEDNHGSHQSRSRSRSQSPYNSPSSSPESAHGSAYRRGNSESDVDWVDELRNEIGEPDHKKMKVITTPKSSKTNGGKLLLKKPDAQEKLLEVQRDILSSLTGIQRTILLQGNSVKKYQDDIRTCVKDISVSIRTMAENSAELVKFKARKLQIEEEQLLLLKLKVITVELVETPTNSQNIFN